MEKDLADIPVVTLPHTYPDSEFGKFFTSCDTVIKIEYLQYSAQFMYM